MSINEDRGAFGGEHLATAPGRWRPRSSEHSSLSLSGCHQWVVVDAQRQKRARRARKQMQVASRGAYQTIRRARAADWRTPFHLNGG